MVNATPQVYKQYLQPANPRHATEEIADALGITDVSPKSITISAAPDAYATVTLVGFLNDKQLGKVTEVLRRYRLATISDVPPSA